jgi:hypothetical protein
VVAAAAAAVGPKGHVVSGSELTKVLKNSFHATSLSSVKISKSLDNANILAGAWVYLDNVPAIDHDMRTILSNKRAGCGKQKEQNGFSMYVNAWQTGDHRLYVEYGGDASPLFSIYVPLPIRPTNCPYQLSVSDNMYPLTRKPS